jgi:large subunit ribosomal protein L5
MFDFMEKLVRITFPRVRDFRGISEKNVDSNGNLTVGFKEHTSFAEIKLEQVDKVHGLEVSLTTNARSKEAGLELWRAFGIPFKKD